MVKAQCSACPLCGGKQTLLHVLNRCDMALLQRHYDQKHNTVLQHIMDFIRTRISCEFVILADLPTKTSIRPPFPLFNLRPDLIVWNQKSGVAYLLELIVCFESNFFTSAERKVLKYIHRIGGSHQVHYTLQVPPAHSPDWILWNDTPGQSISHQIYPKCTKKHQFHISLSIYALTESLKIWSRHNSFECCYFAITAISVLLNFLCWFAYTCSLILHVVSLLLIYVHISLILTHITCSYCIATLLHLVLDNYSHIFKVSVRVSHVP